MKKIGWKTNEDVIRLAEKSIELDILVEKEHKDIAEKIAKKEKAVKEAKHNPTMDESWKEILSNNKMSDTDRKKCLEVKQAMQDNVIGREPTPEGKKAKKFSRAEALRLWKQLQVIRREEILEELVEKTPDNYILVTTQEELHDMVDDFEGVTEIGYDTETTGLDKYEDKIVGHCLYNPISDKSYYVPFRHSTGEEQVSWAYGSAYIDYLLERIPTKILHNAQYDMHMCINDDLPITGTWHCTQTIAHMFNENEMSHALKSLVPKYLGIPSDKYGDLFGNGGFEGTPLKYARYYGANDPKITYQLYKFYEAIATAEDDKYNLKDVWKNYLEIEQPLIKVVVEMERVGFIINEDHMQGKSKEFGEMVDTLESEIKSAIGQDVLLSSPAQLQKALEEHTGEKMQGTGKKILKAMKGQYPIVGKILEWKSLSKLKNDFFDNLPKFRKEKTGRYHSNFKPRGTVTGRFSSQDFNAQQIHKIVRQAFEAPDGMLLLGADFSGQENRLLGHLCQDEKMIQGWKTGIDFYSKIGSDVFNKPYDECGDGTQWRNLSKVIVLAVTYGISPIELGYSILPAIYEDRGINKEVTKEDALKKGEEVIKDFLKAFPAIEPWMIQTRKDAKEKGYVTMMFGNKRRLPLPKNVYMEESRNIVAVDKMRRQGYDLEERRKGKDIPIPWDLLPEWKRKSIKGGIDRQAVNSVIQGSAAEQTKLVMLQLDKWCQHKREHGRDFSLLAPIHDEILLYVPEDITQEEIDWVEKIMTQTVTLHNIEVKTDIAIGKNWKDMIGANKFMGSPQEYCKLWRERNWVK